MRYDTLTCPHCGGKHIATVFDQGTEIYDGIHAINTEHAFCGGCKRDFYLKHIFDITYDRTEITKEDE